MNKSSYHKKGFTLIELLLAISLLGILMVLVLAHLSGSNNKAYLVRTQLEFRSFQTAMYQYIIDYDTYPDDVDRGIPPGLEDYLAGGNWPDGPWPNSVYDWDNVTGPDPYIQLSLRFCDIEGGNCNFPIADWALDFDDKSAVFFCFEGNCRSHPARPIDHPGYCVNCF